MKYKIAYLAIALVLTLNLNAQKTKRSFKVLAKADYLKAQELFQKNLEEMPDDASANFGMALILADEKSGLFNIIDAWAYAVKAQKGKNSLTQDDLDVINEYFIETEVRRTSYPVKKKIDIALEAINDRLIKYIREENNLEAVYELLDRYPDYVHYDNVVHIRNQFEYRKYEKQHTLAGYQEFISKFPEAAQVSKAQKHIHNLLFQEVKNQNTLEAFNNYISKYPESEHLQTAIKLRNATAFNETKQANTIEAFDIFIATYTDAIEIAEARKIRTDLVYQRAKQVQTLEAYTSFIKEYPEGKYYVDIFNLKSESLGKQHLENSGLAGIAKWARAFDNNNGVEEATAMAITSDGGYVVAGSSYDVAGKFSNVWVLKLNAAGVMEWNKQIGQPFNDIVNTMHITSQGEIICIGYTQINERDSLYNGWMFKLGADGKKIWNKNLGNVQIITSQIAPNNNIYMSLIDNDLPDTVIHHYEIQSFTTDGRKNWQRSFVLEGTFNHIEIDENNRMLLAGTSWVTLLDEKKYIVYEHLFESETIEKALLTNNNNYMLQSIDSVKIDYIKILPTGEVNWEINIDKADSTHICVSLLNTADGNILGIESNQQHNTIRKISMQGNLFPDIVFNQHYKPIATSKNNNGDILLLLKQEDIILVCLKLP